MVGKESLFEAQEASEEPEEATSFGESMDELEGILRRIEDEQIDIDVLGKELGRASELLELCRSKIRKAEVEVTQIVQSLDAAAEDSA